MRKLLTALLLAVAGVAMQPAPARAEVKRAEAGAFIVEHRVTIAATPDRVWAVLIEPKRWWDDAHTWSGAAANLSLDARAGGCWCEQLGGDGGSVEHLRVIHLRPSRLLRLSGVLGPLQDQALNGTMTITLAQAGSGTELVATYLVGGFAAMDLRPVAPIVDRVIGQQFARLKTAAETR